MTQPQPLTPQQLAAHAAMLKQQKAILEKRMEVTEKSAKILTTVLDRYNPDVDGAKEIDAAAAGSIMLAVAAVQAMQLALSLEEGRHQLGAMEAQIKHIESPVLVAGLAGPGARVKG